MYRLPAESDALNTVLTAAESFSIPGIKRCPLLNERQRLVLLTSATTPLSLKHQSRLLIRKLLGGHGPYLLEKVQDLNLPDILQDYLLYKTSR